MGACALHESRHGKNLITGPRGNDGHFCFAEALNVSLSETKGNIEGRWKQNPLLLLLNEHGDPCSYSINNQ